MNVVAVRITNDEGWRAAEPGIETILLSELSA